MHLKSNYVTKPCEGCPDSKAPPNAAHKCSFFSLFLEDAQLTYFVTSHSPFFARPKKKKDRGNMATLHAEDRHFRGPGQQKSWRKGKTSGDATRKCSKGSLTRLTRSLRRTRLRRPQRPGPSKDADPELRQSMCSVTLEWALYFKQRWQVIIQSLQCS